MIIFVHTFTSLSKEVAVNVKGVVFIFMLVTGTLCVPDRDSMFIAEDMQNDYMCRTEWKM